MTTTHTDKNSITLDISTNVPKIPAVLVQNAVKSYESGQPVLNNLSINVSKGTIYGLLGASGCGKTTILSCIVGLRTLDEGDIHVFGHRLGTKGSGIPGKTIGYMPQDVALYEIFSIKEILEYFGRIYGMTKTEIKARIQFLISFLDLPDCNSNIRILSGGQQRRTSLAVALIHHPELLILDEPTVGVDPLLRQSIWEHLCDMVKNRGTTVIVTTHYIEEAKQSNMVGIMRDGRLLVEKCPETLLQEYNSLCLETVVLQLCKKDTERQLNNTSTSDHHFKDDLEPNSVSISNENRDRNLESDAKMNTVFGNGYKIRNKSTSSVNNPEGDEPKLSFKTRVKNSYNSHFDKTMSVTIKNFLRLIRYPWFPLALIMIPTFQVFLFNTVIGKDPKNVAIGVVNHELNVTNLLEFCQQAHTGCFSNASSCKYLNLFPEEEIKWIPFLTETEALENVQNGQSWGYIVIPENYTKYLQDRSLLKNFAENETIIGTTIRTRLDMSFNIKTEFLTKKLLTRFEQFIKQMSTECGEDPQIAELPLKFNTVYNYSEEGYLRFLQPGQIQIILFLLPMASSLVYISDRKAGTLDRSMVAGVRYVHILAAFMISEGTLIAIQLGLCFGSLVFAFGFNIQGSSFLFLLGSYLQGITGLSIGFFIGTWCDHEIEAVFCILGIYLPLMVSSGMTWPIEAIDKWIRTIAYMFPLTFNIAALRSIVNRGWGFTHPGVWPGFAVMCGWIIFASILSEIVSNIRNK